jgi:uncharacterized protein
MSSTAPLTATGHIDTCVHHRWPSYAEVREYFEPGWRSYVGKGQSERLFPLVGYPNPSGDDLHSAVAADGTPAGASYESLVEQHLNPHGLARALLIPGIEALMAPAVSNPYLARELIRAINDWSIDRWLSRDERLYGTVLVPTQTPADAAAEIRRIGAHPKIAGVSLMAPGTGTLFGHPVNAPIFEAAVELGLPVIIHRGGDAIPDLPSAPAGGPPLTFAEYATVAPLAVINQVFNLITMGTLPKHPDLRVVIHGAGIAWIPGTLRRLELTWRAMRKELPWVSESPRDYVQRQVRVSTFGLERDHGAEMVAQIAAAEPELADIILYGSGYPNWDTVSPDDVQRVFPDEWHERLLRRNAEAWLRWPVPVDA